jgi:uncharacterized protein (TIGR02596 family)
MSFSAQIKHRQPAPPNGRFSRPERDEAGFTLVELLAVIIIIGLIAGLAAPTLFGVMKANRLTGAGEELMNRISYAQQLALSKNQEIELRFYYFEDPEVPGSSDHFRATSIISPDMTSTAASDGTALSEVAFFKNGIVVPQDSKYAPIFTRPGVVMAAVPQGVLPASDAAYASIRFRPDGTSDLIGLATNECYLTLVDELDVQISDGAVPRNFFAIQIDPYTGRCTSYRP